MERLGEYLPSKFVRTNIVSGIDQHILYLWQADKRDKETKKQRNTFIHSTGAKNRQITQQKLSKSVFLTNGPVLMYIVHCQYFV